MNKKTLSLPVLKKEDIVTAYSQIRPFREGGFRIQKQSFEGKTVFHNYGHGGSGISLSYGSAHKIADLFQAQVKNKQNFCAVLGSGVIGLTTALQLAQRGHKVRIYTKKIPTNGQKINKLMITSEVAPGFWFPYDYLDIRGQQILQLSALSMNFFKKSLQTNRYMALKACQTYDQVYSSEMIKKFDGIYLKNNTEVEVDLGNGAYQKFNQFGTVRIDMQLWLKELIVQLVRIGAQFIPRQFKNEGQVLALKQKFIFNCTGYASKYLFNDMKMKAHRGHIVQFLNPNPEVFNYIFGAKVNNQIVRIYGHQNRILLGLSKEQSEQIQVEEKIVEKLLNNYQSYLNRWSIPAAKL